MLLRTVEKFPFHGFLSTDDFLDRSVVHGVIKVRSDFEIISHDPRTFSSFEGIPLSKIQHSEVGQFHPRCGAGVPAELDLGEPLCPLL